MVIVSDYTYSLVFGTGEPGGAWDIVSVLKNEHAMFEVHGNQSLLNAVLKCRDYLVCSTNKSADFFSALACIRADWHIDSNHITPWWNRTIAQVLHQILPQKPRLIRSDLMGRSIYLQTGKMYLHGIVTEKCAT
jgi:hypothetical protein